MSAAGKKHGKTRREALLDGARIAAGVCAGGLVLAEFARQAQALPADAVRPPFALPDEGDFLAACVRCGLCVRACPYDILTLADLGEGPAHGAPYFTARTGPCEMCDDIPCAAACPTGALDRAATDIAEARMGIAVLLGRETCLNLQGLRCDVCYRVCPLIDEAITLEGRHNVRTGLHAIWEPVVHSDACTGCGKCEKACVLEEAAIKVLPLSMAALHQDDHYRRGWEEKEKAGEALVPDLIDLPDRGYQPPTLGGGGLK